MEANYTINLEVGSSTYILITLEDWDKFPVSELLSNIVEMMGGGIQEVMVDPPWEVTPGYSLVVYKEGEEEGFAVELKSLHAARRMVKLVDASAWVIREKPDKDDGGLGKVIEHSPGFIPF